MSTSAMSDLLNQIGRHTIPSYSEQIHLTRLIRKGEAEGASVGAKRAGTRARQRMLTGNLRLVVNLAKIYGKRIDGNTLELVDLVQEGCLGLNRAIDKFDEKSGYKFSTYATWWIRQSISRAIEVQGRTIRVTSTAATLMRRWRYRPEGQSVAEFAAQHGYKVEHVHKELAHHHRASLVPLDATCKNDDSSSLMVELVAADTHDPLEFFDHAAVVEQLEAAGVDAINDLALVELHHVDGLNLHEVADVAGLTNRVAAGRELEAARERLRVVAAEHRHLVAA